MSKNKSDDTVEKKPQKLTVEHRKLLDEWDVVVPMLRQRLWCDMTKWNEFIQAKGART